MEQRAMTQSRIRGSCSSTFVRECLSVRVLVAVCLFACVALVFVDDSTALPPDFFRVGRGHFGSSSSHWKRTESGGGGFGGMRLGPVSDDDILSVICGYCVNYLNPSIGTACQSNNAESRRLCTDAFLRDMRALIMTNE